MPRAYTSPDRRRPQINSVGIDLHRKRSHVAALDDDGQQLLSRTVPNDREALLEVLGEAGEELKIALEATYGWEWLAELLEEQAMSCTSPILCAREPSPRRG